MFFFLLRQVFRFHRSFRSFVFGAMDRVSFTGRIQVRPNNYRASNAGTKAFRYVTTSNYVRQTSVRGKNFFKNESVSHRRGKGCFFHPMVCQVTTWLHRRTICQILLLKGNNLQAILHPRYFKTERNFNFFSSTFKLNRDFVNFDDQNGNVITMVYRATNGGAVLPFNRFGLGDSTFIIRRTNAIFNALRFLLRRRVVRGIRICLFKRIRCNAFSGVDEIRRRVRVSIRARELKVR